MQEHPFYMKPVTGMVFSNWHAEQQTQVFTARTTTAAEPNLSALSRSIDERLDALRAELAALFSSGEDQRAAPGSGRAAAPFSGAAALAAPVSYAVDSLEAPKLHMARFETRIPARRSRRASHVGTEALRLQPLTLTTC